VLPFYTRGCACSERAPKTSQGFCRFVRSIVGLDRTAVHAFGEFLVEGIATAAQIDFINMVIEHLTDQGVMNPALPYEPPFRDVLRLDRNTSSMKKKWRGCLRKSRPSMTAR
jgi:hypothetical protein